MKLHRPYVCALVALVALVAPGAARAQGEGDAADEALRRGVQLRRERRDEEALIQFRHAYELRPSPRVRAQAGLAEQALGRWASAEADLKAAMETADDLWIARNHDELIDALDTIAQHLGTIEVTANVAGAELRINGGPPVALPHAPSRVEAGEVTLEASAPHRASVRRTVHLRPGATLHEDLVLGEPIAAATPSGPEASTPPPARPAVAPHPGDDARAGAQQRTWGFISFAGAGAFAILGVAGTVMHESHVSHYNEAPECQPNRAALCGSDRDAGTTAVAISAVGYGAAGLLAITGTVLLVTAPKSPVKVGAWALSGTFGATAGARF